MGDTEPVSDCVFSYGKRDEKHELGTGILYVRKAHQQLRR
jgi:hypothetical protein